MQPREAAAATAEVATAEVVTVEVVTEEEGIFTVVAISAAMAAGISAAVRISAAVGAISAVDYRRLARLRGRAFAAVVRSPSITQMPYGH